MATQEMIRSMELWEHRLDNESCVRQARAFEPLSGITSNRRLEFQAFRSTMLGICFSHLDIEPCAECWVP